MATLVERDGIKYRRTSVEIREDLHTYAKENNVNMTALLNAAIERRMKGEK
jgi:hypothetical protein